MVSERSPQVCKPTVSCVLRALDVRELLCLGAGRATKLPNNEHGHRIKPTPQRGSLGSVFSRPRRRDETKGCRAGSAAHAQRRLLRFLSLLQFVSLAPIIGFAFRLLNFLSHFSITLLLILSPSLCNCLDGKRQCVRVGR